MLNHSYTLILTSVITIRRTPPVIITVQRPIIISVLDMLHLHFLLLYELPQDSDLIVLVLLKIKRIIFTLGNLV